MATNSLSAIGNTLSLQSPTQIANSTPPSSSPAVIPSTAPKAATINPPNANLNAIGGTLSTQLPNNIAQNGAIPGASVVNPNAAMQNVIPGPQGTPVNNQQLTQKYQTGLQTAQTSNTAAPQTAGQGSGMVNDITGGITPPPPSPTLPPPAVTTFQQDPGYQKLIADQANYMSVANQQTNAEQHYNDLVNSVSKEYGQNEGLSGINTKLINWQNAINGTEQDVADEVTKAGGFATRSAILAMTSVRNKVLQDNYNNLVQTKQAIENQVNTQMGFSQADKAAATANALQQINFDEKLNTYQQQMTKNAQDAYNNLQKTEGWDGVYKAAIASGDPSAIARINATMGNGFDLATMAQQDAQTKSAAKLKDQQAQANVNADNARANAALAETVRHNKVDEAAAAGKNSNWAAPGQADISKVMTKIQSSDKGTKDSIDMKKLQDDPNYFYWVKAQLGV